MPHRVIIAPIVELPFGKGKQVGDSSGVGRLRSSAAGRVAVDQTCRAASRSTCSRATDTGLLGGGTANRPNIVAGVDLGTAGQLRGSARLGRSSDRDLDQPGGVRCGGARHVRQRAAHDHRRAHADSSSTSTRSFIKNVRLGGRKTAQVKLEVLNLLNRPNVRALQGAQHVRQLRTSARRRLQSGFMRIMQFMVRFSF